MIRTTLAGLLAHKVRLLLSSVAIILGVGFVAGTLVLSDSMQRSFYDSFARGAKNVDAAVLLPPSEQSGPNGGGGPAGDGQNSAAPPSLPSIPSSLLTQIRALPGVASADGHVTGEAPLVGADGKVVTNGGRPGSGINVTSDPLLSGLTLVSGRLPSAPDQVVVDTTTAADQHFALGAEIGVVDQQSQVEHFQLVGTVDPGASKAVGRNTLVGFDTATALRITGRAGFDQLDARAASGVSQQTLVDRIDALRGTSSYQVLTGGSLASQEANNVVHYTSVFTDALLIFAAVALFVAALVINNTFTILIAQRMRELALLRCVGASRRQVFGSTLLESAVVGFVASVIGVGAGFGLGALMLVLFRAFGAPIPSTTVVLSIQTVLVSLLLGTLVTVASALLPARNATKVAPVAALGQQGEPAPTGRRVGWRRIATIVVFGVAGLGLAWTGSQSTDAPQGFVTIVIGGCVFFIAVLAAGPLFVGPITRALGWLPSRMMGAPARLATANARRNPHRVAATTAALTIGITLVTLFTVVSSSVEVTASDTITKHYPFDYEVSPGSGDGGRTVPPAVVTDLRGQGGLAVVAGAYKGTATMGSHDVDVEAVDPQGYGTVFAPKVTAGSLSALAPGTIALDAATLAKTGAHLGGNVAFATSHGGVQHPRVVAVLAVGDEVPSALITPQDFLTDYQVTGATLVYVKLHQGVSDDAALSAIDQATANDPLLQVTSVTQYKASLSNGINTVLGIFSALLGLAILIALFGIANTLSLSVIERTRESALLRALGLTRTQLRRMLTVEAVEMALLGAVIGVVLGLMFGWAVMQTFIRSGGGAGEVSIPWARLVLYFVIAAAAGMVASILPARRAARASIVAAIASA